MTYKKKLFSFDLEEDKDVLEFFARQPKKKETRALIRAVRLYMRWERKKQETEKEVKPVKKKEIVEEVEPVENFSFANFSNGRIR